MVIGGLIFLDTDDSYKVHDYAGVQGIMLAIFRFLLYFAFAWGLVGHYMELQTQQGEEKQRKLSFIKLFGFSGAIYLLSMPTMVVLCYTGLVSLYLQQSLVMLGTLMA